MDILTIILSGFIFAAVYFQIFLLLTYLENRACFAQKNSGKAKISPANLPSATIIVPCWNEEKTIAKTIQSLLSLDYPKDKLFVFVVDDGSTDGTAQIVKPFLSDSRVKYFYKENNGKHSALNFGIERAQTDIVGCLDADSFVAKQTLLSIVAEFADPEIMAVTPAIKVHNPKTIIQKIQETEYVIGIIFRKLLASINAQYVAPGPFSIYRLAVFNIVGKFKQAHNTEDMEMVMRMHQHRLKIGNALKAEVYTIAPETLRSLLRQRLRWTQGFIKNTLDYKFLFFRKGYGNVGLLSLPAGLISIAAALYFVFYSLRGLAVLIEEKITYFSAVGFSPLSEFRFNFRWFFVNTEMITLLLYFSLAIFLILLALSVYHVRGRISLKKSDFYFIFLYGLVAPLWIMKALSHLILWRPEKWK